MFQFLCHYRETSENSLSLLVWSPEEDIAKVDANLEDSHHFGCLTLSHDWRFRAVVLGRTPRILNSDTRSSALEAALAFSHSLKLLHC